jgi:predicted small lipoprotein YifL
MRTLFPASAALAAGLALAACGGGYGEGTVSPPPAPPAITAVPDTAVATATALVSYLGALPADETVETLTLPTADAAVSETDEPVAI